MFVKLEWDAEELVIVEHLLNPGDLVSMPNSKKDDKDKLKVSEIEIFFITEMGFFSSLKNKNIRFNSKPFSKKEKKQTKINNFVDFHINVTDKIDNIIERNDEESLREFESINNEQTKFSIDEIVEIRSPWNRPVEMPEFNPEIKNTPVQNEEKWTEVKDVNKLFVGEKEQKTVSGLGRVKVRKKDSATIKKDQKTTNNNNGNGFVKTQKDLQKTKEELERRKKELEEIERLAKEKEKELKKKAEEKKKQEKLKEREKRKLEKKREKELKKKEKLEKIEAQKLLKEQKLKDALAEKEREEKEKQEKLKAKRLLKEQQLQEALAEKDRREKEKQEKIKAKKLLKEQQLQEALAEKDRKEKEKRLKKQKKTIEPEVKKEPKPEVLPETDKEEFKSIRESKEAGKEIKLEPKSETLTEIEKKEESISDWDEEVRQAFTIIDELLEKLPEEAIDEFVQSEDYVVYERVVGKYKKKRE